MKDDVITYKEVCILSIGPNDPIKILQGSITFKLGSHNSITNNGVCMISTLHIFRFVTVVLKHTLHLTYCANPISYEFSKPWLNKSWLNIIHKPNLSKMKPDYNIVCAK